ncbi:MAG: hypothetical protein RLZZ480_720 [Candidatus Parcubacteria bacterium]|jgi:hypothetical protein
MAENNDIGLKFSELEVEIKQHLNQHSADYGFGDKPVSLIEGFFYPSFSQEHKTNLILGSQTLPSVAIVDMVSGKIVFVALKVIIKDLEDRLENKKKQNG